MWFFGDPLTRRELSGTARRWQTYVARALIGLVMLWAAWYLWRRGLRHFQYGGYSRLAALSRDVFTAYFAGLMALLPLLAAAGTADAVTREVRNGTLGLLFLTPLSPWRIALGKWKAAMAQVLLILLAGGPIAAVCVYLGGVGAWELLWAAALPLASAAFAGAVALAFSTVFLGPTLALISSIVALLAGTFGPLWLLADDPETALELLGRSHPVVAALVSAEPRVGGSPELALYGWITASLFALASSFLVLALAAARLPGRLLVQPGPSFASRVMARLDAFYESINVGRVRFLARSGEVWQTRALLWKELRTRAAGKLRHATRIALALLLLSVLPLLAAEREMREWLAIFVWVFSGLLTLQAVVGGVGLFVQEREGRQWDVLLSTPLGSGEILWAKLAGGLVGLAPTALSGLLYVSAVAGFHPRGDEVWFAAVPTTGVFVVFAFLLSAAASLRAKTQRGAFMLSIVLLTAVLGGPPLLWEALGELPGWRTDGEDLLPYANPGWYLEYAGRLLNLNSYYWYHSTWDISKLVFYLFLYAAACVGLRAWMRAKFDRLAGRA